VVPPLAGCGGIGEERETGVAAAAAAAALVTDDDVVHGFSYRRSSAGAGLASR